MPGVLVWMVLAILAVAALAFWDEQRESNAALEDFAEEQASVAGAVASAISARLDGLRAAGLLAAREMARDDQTTRVVDGATVSLGDEADEAGDRATPAGADPETVHLRTVLEGRAVDVAVPLAMVLSSIRPVAARDAVVLLLRVGDPPRLVSLEGRAVDAPTVVRAFAAGSRWARLDRPSAAALGLPERTAMAGLASLDVDGGGRWGVAVIASARRERDREQRAQVRLLLGVGVASGLVLAFGGLALRKQRKELDLGRELAVAEVARTRDEQLVRADKLATMGALATGIAHEVSTPLGIIVGRAEQLEPRVAADDRGRRAIRDILDQSERISRVVRGFLTLARGESPALERIEPALVAGQAMHLVEHRFDKAAVSLEGDIAAKLPRIACEPRLLEQALANLLLNACDACDAGGHVELRVRADSERVAFIVTDDGAGIAPDVAHRATEPFFTTKTSGKGTGLGLAIANEIVKHHNGNLSIEPRDGAADDRAASRRGTRARIEIPALRGEA